MKQISKLSNRPAQDQIKRMNEIKNEIDILRILNKLECINILNLSATFEDERNIYLITELMENSNLYSR